MSNLKINIVLADDHPALLAGIKHELSNIPTLRIAGAASNSTELVGILTQTTCDVLVTDYTMPGGEFGDGFSLLSFIRRRFPDIKIVVFTMLDNSAMVREMSRTGIKSVIHKSDDLGHLISAIHAVYAGSVYFSPSTRSPDHNRSNQQPDARSRQLTTRETEVVRLYASGRSIGEIAEQLHRSKQTISSQKMSAMRKLGIERDADLFRFVFETGLAGSSAGEQDQC